jgi:mannonate dehydratase
MKLGLGLYDCSDDNLTFAKQFGVTDIIAWTPLGIGEGYWQFDDLLRLRMKVESHGMRLAAIENLPREHYDLIRHGLPGRDEQVERVCETIRNIGRAGIPALGYDFNVVRVWGHWRNGQAGGGRGGSGLTSFDYDLVRNAPPHELGPVSVEEMWERFTWFLRKVVPVAEEYGVKLGVHGSKHEKN